MEQSKKECILNAACRAFGRWGFKKAAVEEIAKEAGVAKGTVYLAADTKEDLFYQSINREVRAYVAEVAKRIDPRVPADQLMAQVALVGFQYLEERPLVRDLMFRNHHLMLPEWSERLDELCELGRANIREILRLGIRQGLFRADLDVDEVAKILEDVAIATQALHLRPHVTDRDARMQRRVKAALDLFMNGMRVSRVDHPAPRHGARAPVKAAP